MIDRFRVGVITSSHGIKGEAKVYPTSDDQNRLKKIKKVYAKIKGVETALDIETVRFQKNMALVKFKQFNTPEEIQALRNTDLFVDRQNATPLKKNENYIADLIGLDVIDEEGILLGKVTDIFPTGANHVMEVIWEKRKYYSHISANVYWMWILKRERLKSMFWTDFWIYRYEVFLFNIIS